MSYATTPLALRWPERELAARLICSVQPDDDRIPGITPYLSAADLTRRWRYTKRGIFYLTKREDFPPPAFLLQGGRTRVWAVADIEAYERDRPELHSEDAKLRKVRGFLRARRKGPQP